MNNTEKLEIIEKLSSISELQSIAYKVLENQRITNEEGVLLFEKADIHLLGILANFKREFLNQKKTYFIRNFHIEPTNICIFNCQFCSYRRKPEDFDIWNYSIIEIIELLQQYSEKSVSEIHITGGVHPRNNFDWYIKLIETVRNHLPDIHIKAFSAVELDYIFKKERNSFENGLKQLIKAGLNSIPGGGAEIFHSDIRNQICPEKVSAKNWLLIHETAHNLGIMSNATMLYGHFENYFHRIDHLSKLRELQDKTHGFNSFIPLKFRSSNNSLSKIGEVSVVEDIKNYCISRIFLDNFNHIKAYWPMLGKEMTALMLHYGVDDIDGTIDDSTRIYAMTGAKDTNPVMTISEMNELIEKEGFIAIERDSLYNELKTKD